MVQVKARSSFDQNGTEFFSLHSARQRSLHCPRESTSNRPQFKQAKSTWYSHEAATGPLQSSPVLYWCRPCLAVCAVESLVQTNRQREVYLLEDTAGSGQLNSAKVPHKNAAWILSLYQCERTTSTYRAFWRQR